MFKEKNMLPLFRYIADFTTAKQLKIEVLLRVCHKKIYKKQVNHSLLFYLAKKISRNKLFWLRNK